MSTKLTKNFYLEEFLVSSDHPEVFDDFTAEDLMPQQIDKLYYLCLFLLQPIRDEFGPVRITSGYRPPKLNRLVGGSETSQHVRCEAADIILNVDAALVYDWLDKMGWPGEVLLYPSQNRLHVSLPQRGVKMDHFIKG